MSRRFATIVVAVSLSTAAALGAQDVRAADSLLQRGNLDRAESEYYAAVRARPRDPRARLALGRYLASRGALRIGATLVDEAIQFGLDPRTGASVLATMYMDLGEYGAIAALRDAPLSASERTMVRWLAEHPSRAVGPDSTVLVAYARTMSQGYLGAVRIRINGHAVLAAVAPRTGCRMRLSDTSAAVAKLRRFPADSVGESRVVPAVADSVGYGRLTVTNVPVSVERIRDGVQAVVCAGALMRYAPTFDARAGLMTMRLSGRAPAPAASSTGFPFRNIDGELAITQAGGWAPLALPQISAMLLSHRWTLDARRGQIFVEP